MLALRAGGSAIGWGYQLQSPLIVVSLAYVMFAVGLSLSGYFSLGASLSGLGGSLASRDGDVGAFFFLPGFWQRWLRRPAQHLSWVRRSPSPQFNQLLLV